MTTTTTTALHYSPHNRASALHCAAPYEHIGVAWCWRDRETDA
jgi:hypothetical protein